MPYMYSCEDGKHLIIAHIVVSMNSNRSQQVSKNMKKGQVINTLNLK
jgi:hypothetical protein